jgi:hypothetical protein
LERIKAERRERKAKRDEAKAAAKAAETQPKKKWFGIF